MTIAQALRRVKKLKGLIAEHQERAIMGVCYESTKIPAFRFNDEVAAMGSAVAEMVELESRIAIANATATVQENADCAPISLAMAIRVLQEIKGRIKFWQSLHVRTGVEKNRESDWDDNQEKSITRMVEVTWVSDVTEQEIDQKIKALQNRFEALNNLVEDANHQVTV